MNDDKYTVKSGHFDVGDGHKLYYQQWGNTEKTPIFHLHGGPGGRCSNKNKLMYDPQKHHVIFHDQRGSGQSEPFASIANNSTDKLVEDIDKIRVFLHLDKIHLSGHSWGSTLALLYAIAYPENTNKLLISGIFTGSREEIEYIQQGGLRTHYPDAWSDFISLVPEKQQKDTGKYYLDKMLNGTQAEIENHVKSWNRLESSVMSIDSDYAATKLNSEEYEETARSLAILEAHYFIHNCFIEDSFILKNAHKLQDAQIVMIHGRFDHVCPPEYSYELAQKIGDSCHLHFVPTSHDKESAMREVQRAYAWSFLN